MPPAPVFPAVAKSAPSTPRGITVEGETTLCRKHHRNRRCAARVCRAGGEMQIVARLPDGSVENLLWLRNSRAEWKQTFYFAQPKVLPKGTLIAVNSSVPAVLLTGEPYIESKRSKKVR